MNEAQKQKTGDVLTRLALLKAELQTTASAFNQAMQGNYYDSVVQALLQQSVPLKAETVPEKNTKLFQERSDITCSEINGSIHIAETAMNRVRLLLRDRKAVYQDEQVDAAREDIFDHLAEAQGHLDRGNGFFPALQHFDQQDHSERDQDLSLIHI